MMERLTKRTAANGIILTGIFTSATYDTPEEVRQLLADYEDTGLTPEEVEELKVIKWWSQCGTDDMMPTVFGVPVDRLRELAAADRDGRVIILPEEKHAWTIRGDIMLGIIKANCRNFDLDFSISDAFREEQEAQHDN